MGHSRQTTSTSRTAIWVPALGGTFFLTNAHMDGSKPIEFFGSNYPDEPLPQRTGQEETVIFDNAATGVYSTRATSAYRRSLEVAVEHGLRSIAFPSISTGAYRYPIAEAAPIALGTVASFLEQHPGQLNVVRFVLFGARDLAVYSEALARL